MCMSIQASAENDHGGDSWCLYHSRLAVLWRIREDYAVIPSIISLTNKGGGMPRPHHLPQCDDPILGIYGSIHPTGVPLGKGVLAPLIILYCRRILLGGNIRNNTAPPKYWDLSMSNSRWWGGKTTLIQHSLRSRPRWSGTNGTPCPRALRAAGTDKTWCLRAGQFEIDPLRSAGVAY